VDVSGAVENEAPRAQGPWHSCGRCCESQGKVPLEADQVSIHVSDEEPGSTFSALSGHPFITSNISQRRYKSYWSYWPGEPKTWKSFLDGRLGPTGAVIP
jgi:hypothetical protein